MDHGALEVCDLPVVSLKQDDAGDAIVDACKSHGFFVLQDHGITLIEELFVQSKAFFDLPRTLSKLHTLCEGTLHQALRCLTQSIRQALKAR
jgi:isopenicillin N synthase-like dioxygenase